MKYLIIVPIVLVISLLFRVPLLNGVAGLTGHNDVTLAEGLRQTTEFVDETVAAVAPDLLAVPAPDNADPAVASQLENNYSWSDHSFPHRGYNDCDSWKNMLFDGWSAMYRVEIELGGEEDAQRLFQETRAFWESKGFEVEAVNRSSSGQRGALFIPGYSLHVNALRQEATITGWTPCLPPS